MMHADYEFYKTTYHGGVIPSEEDFLCASTEAGAFVENLTGPVKEDSPYLLRVKLAECAVAEVVYFSAQTDGGAAVASESVGNHSVTFSSANWTAARRQNEKTRRALLYLSGTPLVSGALR